MPTGSPADTIREDYWPVYCLVVVWLAIVGVLGVMAWEVIA